MRTATDYLSTRIEPTTKRRIAVAASLTGTTVSAFVRQAAEDRARDVIRAEIEPEPEESES